MTNWRTLPRTGKSQFIPLIPEVQQRLKLGQTYKQIHDALVDAERITLGYQQFVKYINKHINKLGAPATAAKPVQPNTEADRVQQAPGQRPGQHPFAHLTAKREDRRNPDTEIHNPVPDSKRIYGD